VNLNQFCDNTIAGDSSSAAIVTRQPKSVNSSFGSYKDPDESSPRGEWSDNGNIGLAGTQPDVRTSMAESANQLSDSTIAVEFRHTVNEPRNPEKSSAALI